MKTEKEQIKAVDRLTITLNGHPLCVLDDLVVNTGKAWIASRMQGVGTAATHMAVGSGTTDADLSDTALESELARVALTTSGGVLTDNTVAFEAEFPPGIGTGPITEIGLFDAVTGGTLICRTVRSVINKEAGDSLGFTWIIEVQ